MHYPEMGNYLLVFQSQFQCWFGKETSYIKYKTYLVYEKNGILKFSGKWKEQKIILREII